MKVTIITGSPRQGENSEKIANKAYEFFKDKGYHPHIINLSKLEQKQCVHCNSCATINKCIHNDKTNEINDEISGSSGIIFISPVYFGSMTSQLKTLIDKTLPLRRSSFRLRGVYGSAIAIGDSRNGGQEYTIQGIHAAMLIHGMIIVGDNNHFGGTIQAPFENDIDFGIKTVNDTFEALYHALERIR